MTSHRHTEKILGCIDRARRAGERDGDRAALDTLKYGLEPDSRLAFERAYDAVYKVLPFHPDRLSGTDGALVIGAYLDTYRDTYEETYREEMVTI